MDRLLIVVNDVSVALTEEDFHTVNVQARTQRGHQGP